jgi:gamma-D-glutamyl-L-lysine dipeptidyl-peptidase
LKTRDLTAENIINSAKSMMGLPYLWGGTSVKGVDCSGFTKTSFYMNGYVIPRDASQQVLAGDEVQIVDQNGKFSEALALKNLKPADLLFFAGGKTSRITHVALYIGNGEFIHSAGNVRINSMLKNANNYDDFQTRTLVSAKRYIGSQDPQIKSIKEHTAYTN